MTETQAPYNRKYENMNSLITKMICDLMFGADIKEDTPQYRMADLWAQLYLGEIESFVRDIREEK